MMAYIIIKARTKQRSLIVTLLDLKNAFGEVHHNLISSALSNHHVPGDIQCLIATFPLILKRPSSQTNLLRLPFPSNAAFYRVTA